ncbi:MAG: type II toxin-antitoxin system VapC family toxin [Bryobacterales bacterium]|nr:type II toxin-antitoxin system VapC family toxin [Bryobacterales bacterium]
MAFVLDASVTACWALADEDHPAARAAMERMRHDEAVVPALWWFEIRNILVVSERRKRITKGQTAEFLGFLSKLRIRIDRTPREDEVMRLARTLRLSVYDAAYLELAARERLPLAALDLDLRKAALREEVSMVG